LDELVKSGFLNDYLAEPERTETPAASGEDQEHGIPVHGEIHTISRGFSGGGCTASQRKRYARSVMSVEAQAVNDVLDVDLTFTKADLRDVVLHYNNPMVISVITAWRRVHRVLVDQGSSTDVIFWSTFNKLQLSPDHLRPYTGFLCGFAGDQMEVRGHLKLRTTFTDGVASRTESIRYLVVNASSAYNILLGRFMVTERPLRRDGDARAEGAQEIRPEPTRDVVERQIGDRTFKLGKSLDRAEQDQVVRVIARHLDAFAWSASDILGIDPNFLCHCLTMDPKVRPVRQRRRKFNEEWRQVIKEETKKLLSVGQIREIQYPEWLENVVLVKKTNGKWRMRVDFTDLTQGMPKGFVPPTKHRCLGGQRIGL